MDWSGSVIWWHVYPLRFVGAEERAVEEVHHRLGRLTSWLDYVADLGCTGVLLAPVFASTSHGYDTLDYFRLDPRLGDDDDLDDFVRQAKDRGLRICLDGVFNHVSADHEIVARAKAHGPGTEEGRWLRWVDGYPRVFEGNFDLVELDLAHPPVAQYITDVMTHWLGRGIDAWRLDAAYAVDAQAWRPILDAVRQAHPDVWIFGEVIHGDYVEFARAAGVDSVTQYELWKAIWSSLNDANLFELDWTLTRHAELTTAFRPQTFIGNHDVTRIRTKLTDDRHLGHAVALLLTLPGIPSIYAGDEQGFTGEKLDQAHGDDAVRPPFPETPEGLVPYGEDVLATYRRLIAVRREHPWLVDAALSTRDVTNTWMVVELVGADDRLELVLNLGDDALPLPAGSVVAVGDPAGPADRVGGHDWAIVRPE